MNKLLIPLVLCILFVTTNYGQKIEFGAKIGMSSYDLAENSLLIKRDFQVIKLKVQNATYGHHFGMYSRVKVGGLFVEPALIFNTNRVDFTLDSYGESGVVNQVFSERYNNLDIPIILGLKIGFLRIQGGPVGHLFVNSSSDLVDWDGYEAKFKQMVYGVQGGLGIDIKSLRLDLMYESNLEKFGDHITLGGEPFAFSRRPSRWIATVGYKF